MSASSESSSVIPIRSLPSGTVTFAFTDIEGSTQRWERDRAAMQDAVRRHDTLVRSVVARHGGHVFKTLGDAFCIAFARPEDAVAAMLEAQRALAGEDFSAVDGLRIRAAIHTGTADERDGDYFGPAVNRVARLLAIGHGGQVLVSGVTADLVQGELPAQASLRDLGEHRLRDLARPEYVYQLLAPELTPDFPPLRSLDTLPNNLPRMRTTFVGRDKEIAAITALLEKHQLVTLVGSGGVGKTRTSLQVAANLLDGSGDGVWFIELAPLSSGDYIPTTVAKALGLALAADRDPLDELVRVLSGKRALLVFDNCEHMVEAAARVISALLTGCPNIKVLASSRQGLGIAGEATYRMPSLVLPSKTETANLTAFELLRYPAISLFVERAGAANDSFSLSDENAPIVADICRRLDGIPLAIELAASRVQILSPRQLRERLDERFRVLTGGSRDVLPRQQTLRALIDWSHDLLDERERTLFRRLGIFVNGFTLEGAVAVGSGDDLDELDVFDLLASLVAKSLVLAEPNGDSLRYRLLESTRVYALEKLADAGERELLARRHLSYFRDLFAELFRRYQRATKRTELNEALASELEDVRAALEGALARSEVLEGADLIANIAIGWFYNVPPSERLAICERFVAAAPSGTSPTLARLTVALSNAATSIGQQTRAYELAVEAVARARQAGDPEVLAIALETYASAAAVARKTSEARSVIAEAEALPNLPARLRLGLIDCRSSALVFDGDFAAAAHLKEQLRSEYRALGNTQLENNAALDLAEIEHASGRTERAIEISRESLPVVRGLRDPGNIPGLSLNLAAYLTAVDDLPGAVEAVREGIAAASAREPEHYYVAIGIEHTALILALTGEFARSARLEGYAEAALQRSGFAREHTELAANDRLTRLLRGSLPADELERLTRGGAALSAEDAIALALEPIDTAKA